MSKDVSADFQSLRVNIVTMTTRQLLKICKPCTVLLEKLPYTVFGELGGRQVRVKRLYSGQKTKFQRNFFQDERCDNIKEQATGNRWRKEAINVTPKSPRLRGRRRLKRSFRGSNYSRDERAHQTPQHKPSWHLFTAFSEMMASLCPGGVSAFTLTEDESRIVSSLLDIPNVIRAKIIEIAATTSGWVRVNPEDITSDWLERLVNLGIISMASNFPDEYSSVLNVLSVPELQKLCEKARLSPNSSKPTLIRELSIARTLDVDIFKLPTENNGIYDMRRIIRVAEPVREFILQTGHLFLLPVRDPNCLREHNNHILKIIRPCLPRNPLLKSVEFDGYSEIFKNREELTRWARAKREYSTLERAIALKKFKFVEGKILEISMRQFYHGIPSSPTRKSVGIPDNKPDSRPYFLRQFSGNFVDVQTLSLGVEALVSSSTNLQLAEEILHLLLNQPDRSVEEKCLWRYLLALIFEQISSPEKAADMARHAAKRACGHCESCRSKLVSLLKRISHLQTQEFSCNCEVMCANKEDFAQSPTVFVKRKSAIPGLNGLKSVHGMENGAELHVTVEERVMHHFYQNGYPKGLDDGGRILKNLCYLAIWEETFATDIPYVFCAPWQDAPFDWGTPQFYMTRENQLKEKIHNISQMQPEELAQFFCDRIDAIGKVAGTVEWNIVQDFDLKGMMVCLTAPFFGKICTRLFSGEKQGFPDLLLWNEEEKKSLFVIVKEHKNPLNSFQQDWLDFIKNSMGHATVAEVQQ